MRHRLLLAVVTTLTLSTRVADACDIDYATPYDLHDRATKVLFVKVDKIEIDKSKRATAAVTVLETFKGTAGATLTLEVDLASSCSPGLAKAGQRGVVFLDDKDRMQGEYDGFERDTHVVDSLRSYGSRSADVRASALHGLAVSTDWTRSYQAAYALANRIDLILALDAAAKDRVIARLPKVVRRVHPLALVAARLHDARVERLIPKRLLTPHEGMGLIGPTLADRFRAETDPTKLSEAIETAKGVGDRIAAMERCEQVRARSLGKFTEYSALDEHADWKALAAVCRRGSP